MRACVCVSIVVIDSFFCIWSLRVVLKNVTATQTLTSTATATATLPRRHVFITVSAAIRQADHTHIYTRVRTVVLECEAYSQFVGFSAFHYFETVVHDGIRSL